jgi:membrane fusion protein (multidrug efflux system)
MTWNPELDASTRNISIRAVVDNRKHLLAPGMFADMNVRSRREVSVLTIPETAIFYNIYGEAVYVLERAETADGKAEPNYRLAARQIDVTYRSKGVAGVTSGLDAGDVVVTAGQLKLYPSLPVKIVDDVPEYKSDQQ